MQLHVEALHPPGGHPTAALALLHGILGTGTNLRTVAKRVAAVRPSWLPVLVDLRNHGQSLGAEGPDTVAQAALDVLESTQHLGVPLRGVIGHSFGGKVALSLAELAPSLTHVAAIDSSPGPRRDARGSESTLEVITLLDQLVGPWPNRDAFIQALKRHGQPDSLARWLAMQLVPDTQQGFRFGPDMRRIHALLESYFELDAWPTLLRAERGEGPRVLLVVGDRSSVFDAAERQRAEALAAASAGHLTVDVLPAGHWVHVDDLEGLVSSLTRWL